MCYRWAEEKKDTQNSTPAHLHPKQVCRGYNEIICEVSRSMTIAFRFLWILNSFPVSHISPILKVKIAKRGRSVTK